MCLFLRQRKTDDQTQITEQLDTFTYSTYRLHVSKGDIFCLVRYENVS